MARIKVGIDPGHGGSDSGAVGSGYLEKDITLDVSLKLKQVLEDIGFDVIMTRDGDWRYSTDQGSDLSARAGVMNEHGVHCVLSIHTNSWVEPRWGVETFTWSGNNYANDFGDAIHSEILKTNLYTENRGRKFDNFAILRETYAVAALVEMAFINTSDIHNVVGREDEWAETLAKGICAYFGVSYPTDKKVPSDEPKTPDILYDMPIIGEQYLDVSTMAAYCRERNPNPKIDISLEELADLFLKEGELEGVRGDLAFCQSMIETGYFKYGGLVVPEQNNYSGIGATNNSQIGRGAWFESPQIGVRAQIQHLKGYASTAPLKSECVDPRYDILRQNGMLGRRTTWKSLSGSWAYPGYDIARYESLEAAMNANADYGSRIIIMYANMKEGFTPAVDENPEVPLYGADIWEKIARTMLPDGKPLLDGTRPNDSVTRLELSLLLDRLIENGVIDPMNKH